MGIPAIIKNKTDRNREDMLTSTLFQAIGYLPIEKALIPILQTACNIKGEGIATDFFSNVQDAKYVFWPRYPGCEPDLLIYLKDSKGFDIGIILIEAKLFSPKSSEAKYDKDEIYIANSDQLEKEYNLLHDINISPHRIDKHLIYLTAHLTFPEDDIINSEPVIEGVLYWTNYYNINKTLKSILRNSQLNTLERKIVKDLIRLLDNYQFTFFDGWNEGQYDKDIPEHQTTWFNFKERYLW